MDILKTLKILLGIEANDFTSNEMLEAILFITKQYCFTECNRSEEDMDDALRALIIDICIIRYNRLGSEGKQGESVGAISDSFYGGIDDLPKSIIDRFGKCRRMRRFRA